MINELNQVSYSKNAREEKREKTHARGIVYTLFTQPLPTFKIISNVSHSSSARKANSFITIVMD